MPSTRDIRRRIKAVKNTAQITKAMEKVAQAKMARAQQAARIERVMTRGGPPRGRNSSSYQ